MVCGSRGQWYDDGMEEVDGGDDGGGGSRRREVMRDREARSSRERECET